MQEQVDLFPDVITFASFLENCKTLGFDISCLLTFGYKFTLGKDMCNIMIILNRAIKKTKPCPPLTPSDGCQFFRCMDRYSQGFHDISLHPFLEWLFSDLHEKSEKNACQKRLAMILRPHHSDFFRQSLEMIRYFVTNMKCFEHTSIKDYIDFSTIQIRVGSSTFDFLMFERPSCEMCLFQMIDIDYHRLVVLKPHLAFVLQVVRVIQNVVERK
jgi:hypothetical protein